MSRNHTTLAGLLLFALCLACAAQSPVQFGFGSADLAPVKFGGKKLPSWLNSDYSPIFNGVNQYALNSDTSAFKIGGADSFTVMSWVKLSSPINATDRRALIGKGDSNSTTGGLFNIFFRSTSSYNGLTLRMIASSGTAIADIIPSTDQTSKFADFSYHHVAIGRSGASGYFIYVDGVSVGAQKGGSADITAAVASNASPMFIGGLGHFGSIVAASQFPGSIAELSIWNRALSQSEILKYKDKRLRGTESGLVALYHMNDNAQTLVDSVGGKNAIASNTIQWTRRNGYAVPDVRSERYCLSFDGVDDMVSATTATPIIATYPFTFVAWAQVPDIAASSYGIVMGIASKSASIYDLFFSYYNNAGNIEIRGTVSDSGSTHYSYNIGPAISAKGFWHHIAFVAVAADDKRLFYDGAQVATLTTLKQFPSTDLRHIAVGATPRNSIVYGKGKSCEISVWDKALSLAEIQALMYSPPPNLADANLKFYVKGNEGTGTNLDDLSTTNATVSFVGAPTWVGRDIP